MTTLRTILRVLGRPVPIVRFTLWYLRQLVGSTFLVASEVVSPLHGFRRGIVRVPMASRTPGEAASVSGLITFTPGTMALEVDLERAVMFVHVLHPKPPQEMVARLQDLERRWLELIR